MKTRWFITGFIIYMAVAIAGTFTAFHFISDWQFNR